MIVVHRSVAHRALVPLVAALLFAACADGEVGRTADTEQAPGAQDSGSAMAGMEGMPGMQGAGESGMLEQMQAHLKSMDGAGADSLQAMLPMHRQVVANMIAQANKDMRDMNMPGDPAWTATVDSLWQDLIRMPELSAAELQQFMPAHGARVTRLMEAHRVMMGGMQM